MCMYYNKTDLNASMWKLLPIFWAMTLRDKDKRTVVDFYACKFSGYYECKFICPLYEIKVKICTCKIEF